MANDIAQSKDTAISGEKVSDISTYLSRAKKETGLDDFGGEEFIEKIKSGDTSFEKLICTPNMMIKLSKLGKILGPKGLMPNPKLGTVSDDIGTAVKNAKSGQVEIRNDKDGNIGLSLSLIHI